MYLLDSCVCIDLMRGNLPLAYDLMRKSDPKQFGIPAVVVAELEYGVERSSAPAKNRLIMERFLAPFTIVPFDETCSAAYGSIRAKLAASGKTIGPNDLLIAATAVARQATLVSSNMKEFKRVPGLRLESWQEIDA